MVSCAKILKRVTRELGMNDLAIICDDVNVDVVILKVFCLCS
jgi:acyl-CoA reductase-like NAD-dependent aldehyde dehydrogenase